MTVWARPPVLGAPFCAVRELGASVVTYCRGRWQPSEQDEIRWEAPEGERCGGCVRELARMARDVEGLRLARERAERKRGTR